MSLIASTARELASRASDGISVLLLWHPDDNGLTLSVEDAGKRLGISRGLAYALVASGEIPSLRLGRRLVAPVRALEAMLDVTPNDHAAEPAAPTPSATPATRPTRRRPVLRDVALPFNGWRDARTHVVDHRRPEAN